MRMEIGDKCLKQLADLIFRPALIGRSHESIDSLDRSFSKETVACAQNLRVIGRKNVLCREEHLLVQLLAGANAGETNLDVCTNLEAGETNEVSCNIDDADLLAHVENEHLTTTSERTCLENQLHRFG